MIHSVFVGMEEQEKVAKHIHDRVNLVLKPYHDILGVEIQMSNQPEVSLRFLFQMPNGKKCLVKLNQKGLKSKSRFIAFA